MPAAFTEQSPPLSKSFSFSECQVEKDNHNPSKIFRLESEQKQSKPPKKSTNIPPPHTKIYLLLQPPIPTTPSSLQRHFSEYVFWCFVFVPNLSTLVGTGSVFPFFFIVINTLVGHEQLSAQSSKTSLLYII